MPFSFNSKISIHAPLRERRLAFFARTWGNYISIHAPLRERRTSTGLPLLISEFQSTLPYGSDPLATRAFATGIYFNPRSLTGATFFSTKPNVAAIFQSTLPYGSDPSYNCVSVAPMYFNPRSLTGATSG